MEINKYKIMIMTASVGYGHDQAAQVMKKNLMKEDENVEIEIIDFMDIFPSSIGHLIKSTYLKMIDMVPSWYNLLYQGTMKLNQQSKVNDLFSYKYKKKILALILEANPDLILFTNPFPSTMVSHLKRRGKINIQTASIITDYTAHRVWLDPTIDNYFVGSNILKQEMVDRGIEATKIHVTGIPIDSKFNLHVNRDEVMKSLELDSDLPTLLIMGGGLGLGSIEEVLETIDSIDKQLQLIVVAGKNEQLKEELENRVCNPLHKVRILGFCDNVHELMACSHLLVSKAGGLTMTEAVTKQLPVLVFDPIPGQEVKNAQYFSDIGAAMYLKNLDELKSAIIELLYEQPGKRLKMVKCCSVIRRPQATRDVLEYIFKIMDEDECNKAPMIN